VTRRGTLALHVADSHDLIRVLGVRVNDLKSDSIESTEHTAGQETLPAPTVLRAS
jgi:hypothetical protein